MIIIIAGPSGSGKTTFIKYLNLMIKDLEIISVDVVSPSRQYKNDVGRNNISFDEFKIRNENNTYSAICSFDSSLYGFALPNSLDKKVYVLDYPGEYPECKEVYGYDWIGVLILPPSERDLISRLKQSNRENRIPGACIEYKECIEDIKNGVLNNWIVIINDKKEDFNKGIRSILKKIHY